MCAQSRDQYAGRGRVIVGIEDVARTAGVSTATVSRALRGFTNVAESTRAAVHEAAITLGYVPSSSASGLASGKTRVMGVVLPNVTGWFYAATLEGIDRELRLAGYDTMLFNLGARAGERERIFHRSILRKRTDAVIALCIDFTSEEKAEFAAIGHPVIIVGGAVRGLRNVGINEKDVGRRATEHLLGLGHRDVAFLGADDATTLNRRVPQLRRAGYREAMARAGCTPTAGREFVGAFSLRVGREVMRSALADARTRPTAVFAASDEMAIGTILAAQDLGIRVPEQVSVIGIDDHPLAEPFALTTFRQDPGEQGALAARIVLEELAGRPPRRRSIRLPVTLAERGSTAPPPR